MFATHLQYIDVLKEVSANYKALHQLHGLLRLESIITSSGHATHEGLRVSGRNVLKTALYYKPATNMNYF